MAACCAVTVATGCGSAGAAPSCKAAADCSASEECVSAACVPYAVCPANLEPTFESIQPRVLATSCGTSGAGCHSTSGSVDSGGLNLADDPYSGLLGADGQGAPAANIAGTETGLRRVVPQDPDHSFLVIKLLMKVNDPRYGHGMPFPSPGSVCEETLGAIRSWIGSGAKR